MIIYNRLYTSPIISCDIPKSYASHYYFLPCCLFYFIAFVRGKATNALEWELKILFIICLGARTEAEQSEDSEKRVASTFGELAGSHQVTESGTFAICRWSILCRCWWYCWSKIVYWIGSVNFEREFHYDSQMFWIRKHNILLYPMVWLVTINIWCLNI